MSFLNFGQISYLCIGHCCHDLTKDGIVLGGTAAYSGQILARFNISPILFTSVGSDFEFANSLSESYKRIIYTPASATTLFENIETTVGRKQKIHQRASILEQNDLLTEFLELNIIHFAPIANEINPSLTTIFGSNSLKVATIQGWFRAWDEHKNVYPKAIDESFLSNLDVVIMSEEDIFDVSIDLIGVSTKGTLVVKTMADRGAEIYEKGNRYHFPSIELKAVRLIGAGDVFSTVFFIIYQKTRNITLAISWAHAAASFHVEGLWSQCYPSLNEIQERADSYRNKIEGVISL